MTEPAPLNLMLRPAEDADEAVLKALFFEVQGPAFAPLPPDIRTMILDQQFIIQSRAYALQFPGAETLVIEGDGIALGRLILHRDGQNLRILDIAVAAKARSRGIGGSVLRLVQAMAGPKGMVALNVRAENPARRLYQRLGFVSRSETSEMASEMVWCAADLTGRPG